jgi:hypothetical protein
MADYTFPPAGTTVVPPLPRSDGGLIQSVKVSTVEAMRDALQNTSMFLDHGRSVYIGLDYPMEEIQYPGIWVQFSVSKLNRAGVGHEITVQDPNTLQWSFIQEWMFLGRITLTIAALKSIDRDRLCDAVIASLAFARTPEILLTQREADTKKYRSLITSLDENPYIGMTLQLDTIICGGEQAAPGTPWAENIMTYENSFSFDLVGQFNQQFSHDGMYTLARIDPNFTMSPTDQPYNPIQWLDAVPTGPVGPGLNRPSGLVNPQNVNIPAF